MILQALNHYYQILLDDPETQIPAFGFSTVPVQMAIILSEEGELLGLTSLLTEEQRGKRSVNIPIREVVPEQVQRAGRKIVSNFLWDNAAYVLGISDRDATQPEYSQERHSVFKEQNLELLDSVDCVSAIAVRKFLNQYDPGAFKTSEHFLEHADQLMSGNLIFKILGMDGFVHEDPEIKKIWKNHIQKRSDSVKAQCLVTGKLAEIELTHAKIKGVLGGQPAGTAIVSFNESAYESYNRSGQQGLNSPVSKEAVFAYTTALNFMLHDSQHHLRFDDTTVVFWAESADKIYNNIFNTLLAPSSTKNTSEKSGKDSKSDALLERILVAVKEGRQVDRDAIFDQVDGGTQFHVLGLSPNAARLSIRFYYTDPFIKAIESLLLHHEDMLIGSEFNVEGFFPIWRIIRETVSPKAKKAQSSPLLAGALFRSILKNLPYPAALYNAIMIRIRADQEDRDNNIRKINSLRAAIVKATLTRKYRHHEKFKEELQMSLNKDSTNQAYLLGRLFAVMERAQQDAAGRELNATIKDRYFTSACATPAHAFPILLRLSQHHISKGKYGGLRDRDIQEIMDRLEVNEAPFPKHLNLDEQGIFVLGYYHQKADFFKKKAPTTDIKSEEE